MAQGKPNASAQAREGPLHIVLFGMPDAGKTSLLGALVQAAQKQSRALHGELDDASGKLLSLQQQVYADKMKRTDVEVVGYPVVFHPMPEGNASSPAVEAIFYDCDGRAANQVLNRPQGLAGKSIAHQQLARTVLDADTLVLPVDAAARPEVNRRDSQQFLKFLHQLQQSRSKRSEVNGLPVYLVLTKCDLLAKKSDTAASWMEQIEEHKRRVYDEFQEALARDVSGHPRPFGSVDLNVWATAIRRPALGGSAVPEQEPYGVAELFRQCLHSAVAFHQRRRQARQRLGLIVGGVLGVVAVMALMGVFFFATREGGEGSILGAGVTSLRTSYPEAGKRWEQADELLPRLKQIKKSPAFKDLPQEQQDWIEEQLTDLQAYQEYRDLLDRTVKKYGTPREISLENDLKSLRSELKARAPLPQFADSPAVRQRNQWLRDTQVLERAVTDLSKQYQALIDKGKEVEKYLADGMLTEAYNLARETLREAQNLPAEAGPIPHVSNIHWRDIYRYFDVQQRQAIWQPIEARLTKLVKVRSS
jgi:hypothetical protein